ncbi:hypothetical protein BCR36DRAFT_341482 [Piromyces finnis]|uniref:Uncharacterized protein n=1 Tax=Piromyces finnis TaxID=1754191 RepID=A0A1Y1VP37_9FUNG|nr:hypothetical protein BCR36DRAFT_341482 [Piromyces finnis]|eukprot:ORX61156.1 hypothetical protein BCR36DRAFT_341482 [Piromyces finnis]
MNYYNYTFTNDQWDDIQSKKKYFIGNDQEAGYWGWVFSKGTNFDCYVEYMAGYYKNSGITVPNNALNTIRTIINAFIKPVNQSFFYWTLLLCIIHKFNFQKPVMKLVLGHYVFRTIGDIIDTIGGGFLSHYFAYDNDGKCIDGLIYTEVYPLKFFMTRQINLFFWYAGEIIGDWYPLLRTKAVARDRNTLKWVYMSCGLFNLSKIAVFFYQWTLDPKKIYRGEKRGVYNKVYVDGFYNGYWIMQCVIIACSLIYDITVYMVLKKQLFDRTNKNEFGFLKKFRSISEYRIVISAVIGVIGLPISLFISIGKYYFFYIKEKTDIDFNFEDLRTTIANVQYFMIFIDQILLLRSKDESTIETYNNSGSNSHNNFSTTSYNNYNNYSTNGNYSFKKSNYDYKKSNLDSKSYFSNLSNLNNSSNTLTSNAQNGMLQYNYTGSAINSNSFGMLKNNKYSEVSDKDWNY